LLDGLLVSPRKHKHFREIAIDDQGERIRLLRKPARENTSGDPSNGLNA